MKSHCALADEHDAVLFTAAEAGPMLGVRPDTVTKWKRRGLRSRGRRGRAELFAWGDLLEIEFATRRSGRLPRARRVSDYSD